MNRYEEEEREAEANGSEFKKEKSTNLEGAVDNSLLSSPESVMKAVVWSW